MKDKPDKISKKPNIWVRLFAFLVTLALVTGAVTLVVYRDRINLDALFRAFTYRSLSKNDSGQAESFSFESSAHDVFASAGGNLLLCSAGGVRLYSGSGTAYEEQQVAMTNPVADAVGNWSLAWDAGGRVAYVFKGQAQAYTLTLEAEQRLLSARVNASGYLATVTQSSGYKGSVTVYNPTGTPELMLNLSSSFIMDALVTADNKTLAVVTMGEGGGSFESRLCLYALERTEEQDKPDVLTPLGSSVVLELRESDDGYRALGDQSLVLAGHDGAILGTYDFGGRYLKEFSQDGEDFTALLLGKYRAGTLADLVVVDSSGIQTASLPMNEQVLSLSAAGRYVAVLTADCLSIYTADLEPYSTLEGTQGAQTVLMRADGSAMLITESTARLYIPK